MNEKIKWTFPLKGVTESYSTSGDFFLKTKCRVSKKHEFKINLPGNPYVDESETYSLELSGVPKEFEHVIPGKWIKFKDIKNTLTDPADYLIFEASFAPLKPFKMTTEMTINKSSGGRWKFRLFLEALLPDPDDKIEIISPINKTSSVSFKLTNIHK
mmetsp:Transcript_30926/g.28111  ORF Transcript_30926/g.28111 Transcript_30926/m.28111 type:complete len:157 (+) Transcript_30926:298-768(+)